ncbi:uncharacterized protein LOC133795976 [Humulus lupulus]|uniref:uncharacterized protein LOC133795976 n=1 Tax=Humulus lupulus TaxID=3486 RepID=UPI002B4094C6|nr:uncharacterized protein LOC133795976 [Humulus lupulus]
MPFVDMFDLYNAPDALASKKKVSSSITGSVAKSFIEDPPAAGPSKDTTPTPSPLEQPSPPAPVGWTPHPPAPVDQTQPAAPAQTGDDLSSHALRWLCSGVITEQSKASEQRHTEEIKVVEAKYKEQLEAAQKANAALLEGKNKMAEEMKEKQAALDKALEAKVKYKDSHLINFREAKKLEVDLIESRQEFDKLEARIKDLEKANARNLERYKGTTSKCFYDFWKHNQGANFSYLSERMRQTEIARCIARLEEEERAKTPASPEISLAIGIEGVDNEFEAAVDQENPQDPPAS